MNRHNDELREILRNASLWGGILLVVISIFFSWDGLDQQINLGNPTYSLVAKGIGIVLALLMTLLQFIYHLEYDDLNKDLKVAGLGSYIYSIVTNYWGIQHIFGFDPITTAALAAAMDIIPESLIAKGMGSSMDGGVIDNLIKGITGRRSGTPRRQFAAVAPNKPDHQDTQPRDRNSHQQGKKGQGRDAMEAQYHGKKGDEGHEKESNRFKMFEE